MNANSSTWSQITNSPLNTSKTKQCYSIPKAQRFVKGTNNNCAQAFYDLPAIKDQRATALGYGYKYDFTKTGQKTPAPNAYSTANIFVDNKRAKSFGVSREKMAQFGIMGNIKKKAPGPGDYDIKPIRSNVAFSIHARTNIFANTSTLKVPGPGQYDNISSISNNGKFFLSKFKDSKAPVINPSRSARFEKPTAKGHEMPGPGYYNPNVSIKPDGKYFVSAFKDSKCRSFSHSARRDLNEQMSFYKTPGPGSYRLPSEFGYYEKVPKNGDVNRSVEKAPENSQNNQEKKS